MVLGLISPYIITTLFAWVAAHAIKFVISAANKEKRNLRAHLFISGGMPSSHSAAVVSMATIIGLRDGIDSGLFGVASLFALIVMYDAMKVRRSSGEQGIAIHQLIKEAKSKVKLPRVAMGHTPLEVSLGAILGLSVGIIVFFATK
jgi:acid phosphatase family membrane protein YuiD